MPEILKQQNYSVCDRLDNFCQECIANNYQDCSDHGGRPSGDSTVLGKRRVGDNAFEDLPGYWNKQGGYKKKGDTKPASKRTNASAEIRALMKNTITGHNGGQDPSEGQDPPEGEDPPEGQDGEDQENCLLGGGVRYRVNLKKFVVEYRPCKFKWKLWMGTYPTRRDGQRAYDCAKYYAGQEKGRFYFPDSPVLFAQLGPLTRPFSVISKESKDKAFNLELKNRAKEVIKKDAKSNKLQKAEPKARTSLPIAQPFCMLQDVEHMLPGNQSPAASIQACDHLPTSGREFAVLTPESVTTANPYLQGSSAAEVVHVKELCKSSKKAVPVAREYVDPAFDGLEILETLPEVHSHHYYPQPLPLQSSYYVPEFDMVESGLNHQYQGLTSSWLPWYHTTGDQDSEEDMPLWNYER